MLAMTGGDDSTVSGAEPEIPLGAVAVMCAVPLLMAVARPPAFTVATEVVSDAQVKVSPEMRLPFASAAVAVNCWVWAGTRMADAGETVTVATGPTVVLDFPTETPAQAANGSRHARIMAAHRVRGKVVESCSAGRTQELAGG